MRKQYVKSIVAAVLMGSALGAQTYPLSENFWKSQEFQSRIMGSYGAHSELEPKLSDEEGQLFRALIPVLESDLEQGAQMLRSSIAPSSSAALDFMLGTISLQLDDYAAASKSYETAIRKFPNFMRAYKNLGIAHIQNDQLEKGARMLIKGMELGGPDAIACGLLGYSYLNREMYSAALNAYNLAIAFDPSSKDWKLGKVRCLVEMEAYAEASGLIRELIGEDADNPELYLYQANMALAREDTAAAMANLEIVRRMSKGTEASLFLLADIYANRGMLDLAVRAYDEALEAAKVPSQRFQNLNRAIRSFIEFEAWDGARELAQLAESRMGEGLPQSDRATLLNTLAEIELGSGDSEAAARTLERIVEEDPMNGRALLLLARYHWKAGDREEATFLYQRASGIEGAAAKAYLQMGQMLVESKQYREAASAIRKSLDIEYEANVADYLRAVEEAAASQSS